MIPGRYLAGTFEVSEEKKKTTQGILENRMATGEAICFPKCPEDS